MSLKRSISDIRVVLRELPRSIAPAAVVAAMVAASPASAQPTESPGDIERAQRLADGLSLAFEHAAESVAPSVVSIRSAVRVAGPGGMSGRSLLREFFGDEFFERFDVPEGGGGGGGAIRRGRGTGFVVSEDGFILTNNHVVRNASEVRVQLSGGEEFTAEVVGADPGTDLALLKIDASGLTPVTFGDSDGLRIGEWVVAVGDPFGLESTITVGIVSAKGRRGVGITDYEDFIQTDAAINPGNSGGPLVNTRGEVIGVSTAIATRTGGNLGVGFAIPSSMAESIYKSLRDDGVVTRGYLGVTIQDLNEGLARSFGFEGTDGVLVAGVEEGGPADEAGLREGDIIVSLDGDEVTSMSDLRLRVAAAEPGSELGVRVFREGRTRTFTARLGEREPDLSSASRSRDRDTLSQRLGLGARTLGPELARQLGADVDGGVVVTEVRPLSPAARAGLRPRDIITRVGETRIENTRELRESLLDSGLEEGVRLTVLTGGRQRYVFLSVDQGGG